MVSRVREVRAALREPGNAAKRLLSIAMWKAAETIAGAGEGGKLKVEVFPIKVND
ncbi:MAG: hypothetical protein QXI84_05185 [Thermofilaceae archaeon]